MRTNYIHMDGRNMRALLDGRKTQTRRVVKPQPENKDDIEYEHGDVRFGIFHTPENPDLEKLFRPSPGSAADKRGWLRAKEYPCPHGQPGDLLWVREAWANDFESFHESGLVGYRADWEGEEGPWRPSIHMPRWASRLTLYLTDVRVERVQDITEADAWAEGVTYDAAMEFADEGSPDPALAFLNGSWGSQYHPDTWVWALTFRVIHANVDDVLAEPDRYIQAAA